MEGTLRLPTPTEPMVTEPSPVEVNAPAMVKEAATGSVKATPSLTFTSLQERFRNSGISVESSKIPRSRYRPFRY